jgi:outer membrane protein assembly factor BamB
MKAMLAVRGAFVVVLAIGGGCSRGEPSRIQTIAQTETGSVEVDAGSENTAAPPDVKALLAGAGDRGLCVVLDDAPGELAMGVARHGEWRVYTQSADATDVLARRKAADAAGLLGTRLFVQQGPASHLNLADNLADVVIVHGAAAAQTNRDDLLRVLRPEGLLITPDGRATKTVPENVDDWSHPYHGPDNNPQSRDRAARAPYLTHFTAEPWYSPMPLVTVASGGRLFKAFGHISVKEREWPWLNTLIAQNAYNGTLLWKRPLSEGFMIHRNTFIATPDTLYLADNRSCQLIDAATGEDRDEIVLPPDSVVDGTAWKWMALSDGVLYVLAGPEEAADPTVSGKRMARGWPWGGTALGKGYNEKVYGWGFGRTVLALDRKTKKILWTHRSDEPIDSRALCMAAGRMFLYSHKNFLACLDTSDGNVQWKTSDPELFKALGEHKFAQNPKEGFSSTCYAKCSDRAVYFAGPTRANLVAVSADDGRLLWTSLDRGNSQLVLRDDGLYAMSPGQSSKYDYFTGEILETLGQRINCTRATGSLDSIFVRGGRDGTVRYDLASNTQQHLCPMRPSCQDGVIPAYGHLYWGPWMCDCNLTLVGVISLAPAGDFDFAAPVNESERLITASGAEQVAAFDVASNDWPTLRGDNQRRAFSGVKISAQVQPIWTYTPTHAIAATAPVSAGGMVFVGGRDGAVRARDAAHGRIKWTFYTGGDIACPPSIADGRLYVGSGDGWVYALEAATGRQLWRFRAAPVERTIPVYGLLRSTWPAASGVLVADGTAYVAAGMANHDGTHVYALDAATGKLRWHNSSSGSLNSENHAGVSVNGSLLLKDGKLYLAGGNMVAVAVYDTATGKCLTDPLAPVSHTQFRAGSDLFAIGEQVIAGGFPLYTSPGDYRFVNNIALQTSQGDLVATVGPHDSTVALVKDAAPITQPGGKVEPMWLQKPVNRLYGVAVTDGAVLVLGGHDSNGPAEKPAASLRALSLADGSELWQHALPSLPVSWGLAVDQAGRIVVSLQDGTVMAFGAKQH